MALNFFINRYYFKIDYFRVKNKRIFNSTYIFSDDNYAFFDNFKIFESKIKHKSFIVFSTKNKILSIKNVLFEERYEDLNLDFFENIGFVNLYQGYLDLRDFKNCKLVNFNSCESLCDIKFDNKIKFIFSNVKNMNFINEFIISFENNYGQSYNKILSITIINSNINEEASYKLRKISCVIPVVIRNSNIFHIWKDNFKFDSKSNIFLKSVNKYFRRK